MIYGSIGLIALFASGGMLLTLRGGGGIRGRFRSEPLVGLLGLISLYLVISLPSDELWHTIYGRDLTAWSLPHLLLGGGASLVILIGVAVQLSLAPPHSWRGLRGLSIQEFLGILLIALGTTAILQIGTSEWEGITSIGRRLTDAFWRRPEWLYPVVVVTVALFGGAFALHALRRAGAATLTAIFALGFRLALLAGFDAWSPRVRMGFVSQLLLVPPMVALDLWYALRLRRREGLGGLMGGSLLAGSAFLVCGLPIIAGSLVYPRITAATLPGMVGMGLAMALAGGWAGARLGSWIGSLDRRADEAAPIGARVLWISVAMLVGAVAFLTIFILTARPPVR